MNKDFETNEQLSRMKSLMTYGLQTESKEAPYSSVEYKKLGADGKVYGIVREGTKFYIKSADNKANLLKEDFSYIGGFRNRKDNEYTSYANAQKNFDLKMMSLKEAYNKKDFNINSWNLDKKEGVVVEATEKMKKELLRERQIMKNATVIAEKKGDIEQDLANSQKNNIKAEKPKSGKPQDGVYTEKGKLPKEMTEASACPKCGKTPCACKNVNETEVLGWNRNDDYMDKSHGTEIGSSAPFDAAKGKDIDDDGESNPETGYMKNGTVEEGAVMHTAKNQNTPTPGVGKIGDTQPFDAEKGKQIEEAVDDIDVDDTEDDGAMSGEEPMGDDAAMDGEEPMDGEEDDFGADDAELDDDADLEADDELESDDSDLEGRMDAMEELLSQIASKLGVEEAPVDAAQYGDDDLFDDDDVEDEDEIGLDDDEDEIDDCTDFQPTVESRRRRNATQIFETRNFKRAMRKLRESEEGDEYEPEEELTSSSHGNRLNDFGKHPAYQKKVMELPPNNNFKRQGQYDMNDTSVDNEQPYGEKIGSSQPFDIKPESIENAIAESIMRFKKKSNGRLS